MAIDIDEIAAPYEFELELMMIEFEDRMKIIQIKSEILELRYLCQATLIEVCVLYKNYMTDSLTEWVEKLYFNA